jgi:putative integral membrane protein (TIGR02587 family)
MASEAAREEAYLRGLARAAAGALIFGFPLLMTMEMWQLGFHMDRLRLAAFLVVIALTVMGLARFAGFRDETNLLDDVLDAAAALLVGAVVSAAMLALFGLIGPGQGLGEVAGMVAVQAAPASIGAILANKQLHGQRRGRSKEDRAGYLGQLFLMAAGAVFFAFNVAPTEEMILIGFKMTPWHAVALIGLSLAALHALVFSVGFGGQETHEGHVQAFFHYTLGGYGVALLVSAFTLWAFGRLDAGLSDAVRSIVVLAFPSALGAAIARLVV